MPTYVRRKIIHLIPITFAVTALSFLFIDLLPGDVADAIAGVGTDNAIVDEAAVQAIREDLGLDKPIYFRYVAWLGGAFQGELGKSYQTGQMVSEAIALRLPVTLQLLLMAQFLAVAFAVPAGIVTAYRAGKATDQVVTTLTFIFLAAPSFVIAIVLAFTFAVLLNWFPATGYVPITEDLWGNIRSFTLPAISLALIEWPILSRVLRNDMIATLQEDYISLAKAKGLSDIYILFRHALRPSSFTLITIVGIQLGNLISGAVIVESIFALPGIGSLLIESIHGREVLMVQGIVALIAVAYVAINLAVDLLYGMLDPRVLR
ncbi:MAG: peptide ABC transporter [Rhodospirillaceae bacterium]|nr:peptide ABC transporter [Rhodospirillaceae bacterium]